MCVATPKIGGDISEGLDSDIYARGDFVIQDRVPGPYLGKHSRVRVWRLQRLTVLTVKAFRPFSPARVWRLVHTRIPRSRVIFSLARVWRRQPDCTSAATSARARACVAPELPRDDIGLGLGYFGARTRVCVAPVD